MWVKMSDYFKTIIKKDLINEIEKSQKNQYNYVNGGYTENLKTEERLIEVLQKSLDNMTFLEGQSHLPKYETCMDGNSIKVFIKRLIRKATYWFINPIVEKQSYLNEATMETLGLVNNALCLSKDLLIEQIKINVDLEERLKASEERLKKVEDKERFDTAGLIDYAAFEKQYRGSRADIINRISRYTNYFLPNDKVIDIGCGRGEFLEICKTAGLNATGIDIYEPFINECQDRGFSVISGDAIESLDNFEDNSLDGIVSIQVIEHLPTKYLIMLVEKCYSKLKQGGTLILETQNPQSVYGLTTYFYQDFEHVKPVHPDAMKFTLTQIGYEIIGFEQPDYAVAHDKLIPYEENLSDEFNEKIKILNEVMYASADYTIIARKVKNK